MQYIFDTYAFSPNDWITLLDKKKNYPLAKEDW